jgi:hypothetical protein
MLAAVVSMVVTTAPTAQAASSMRVSWKLDPAYLYMLGVDHVTSAGSGSGYEKVYEYPGVTFASSGNQVLPNPFTVSSSSTLSEVRLEFYKRCKLLRAGNYHDCTSGTYKYSTWEGDTGVVARVSPRASVDLGQIIFPVAGTYGTGELKADFVSHRAIPDRTIRLSMFQLSGQHHTSSGQLLDAFASGGNLGSTVMSGPLWNGRYLTFITDGTDPAHPRKVTGVLTVNGATNLTFDLDAMCFGIDECQASANMPAVPGEFHPVTPTRIVDTAHNLGIAGAVRPGDGRLSDPNPVNRKRARLNHEFVVTGVGGVPKTGVGAVLLNVTQLGASVPGSLAIFQKPPHADSVFNDQASFKVVPTVASQLFWQGGDKSTSQVLVRVGAGGRVRIVNRSKGSTHLLVEVVGWVDESQPGQNGLGLVPVTHSRVFDTRTGVGTARAALRAGQVRTAAIPVPARAQALVANIGVSPITHSTTLRVWPTGTAATSYASVAVTPPQTRSNLVTGMLSPNLTWNVKGGTAAAHVNIDVQGYFAPQSGAHGRVTTLTPVTVKTTTIGAYGAVRVRLAGTPGMPRSGVAGVYVNVTISNTALSGALAVDTAVTRNSAAALRAWPKKTTANLVLTKVASDGSIVVRNGGASSGKLTVELVAVVAA